MTKHTSSVSVFAARVPSANRLRAAILGALTVRSAQSLAMTLSSAVPTLSGKASKIHAGKLVDFSIKWVGGVLLVH